MELDNDGSSLVKNRTQMACFAVVATEKVIESGKHPNSNFTQKVELIVLTK